MQVRRITLEDDLPALVSDINSVRWDDANEITAYKADDLAGYLQRQDTVFIACYDTVAGHYNLLGIASARIQIKPYDREHWLYIDEVDVCADQRQKGAGKAMMGSDFHRPGKRLSGSLVGHGGGQYSRQCPVQIATAR